MKFTLLLVALCLAIGLVSAVRNQSDKRHVLVNRPKIDEFGPREKRYVVFGARGKRAPRPLAREGGVKGQRPVTAPPRSLEIGLRKGEYICGNKVCKLEPGVVPKGCNGICQYPIL